MTTPAITAAVPAEPRRGVPKVLAAVLGSLGALVAIALLLAGLGLVWADTTQRDGDGYFTTRAERLTTGAYALTHERVELREAPGWIVDRLGTVRIRATAADGTPLFVGIASEADLDRYLAGVAHDEVVDLKSDPPYTVETRAQPGGAPSGAPTEESFWAASASGSGTQTVSWEVAEGNWAFVVMNADGSRAVAADIELGAKVDWMLAVGLALVAAGALIGLGSAAMIFFGVRTPGGGGDAAFAGAGAGGGATGAARASAPDRRRALHRQRRLGLERALRRVAGTDRDPHVRRRRDPALPRALPARAVRVARRAQPLGLARRRLRRPDARRVPALPAGAMSELVTHRATTEQRRTTSGSVWFAPRVGAWTVAFAPRRTRTATTTTRRTR